MAFINIDSFGGVALGKFSTSGLDKLANTSAQTYNANDFDLSSGDTLPWISENWIRTNDGVAQFTTYAGRNGNLAYTYIQQANPEQTLEWRSTSPFWNGYKLCIAVSDDANYGYIGVAFVKEDKTVWEVYKGTWFYDHMAVYIAPAYNWQSVPSISGKNGILVAMSTISDWNDGEPVTTTDTTKFTLVEESNVGVITEDIDDSIRPGADAGGISGGGSNSGNQSTGYAFGQGESGVGMSGGGSGLYGGYSNTQYSSSGAGSGYIGNSLVTNKKMVGFSVPTSDVESTKTESVEEASEAHVSGKPKIGNGFVRISFVRDATISPSQS